MKLYVIFDLKGSGRLLGVYDSKSNAEQIVELSPEYYKLYECELNKMNQEILRWVDDAQTLESLKQIIRKEK